MDFIASGTVDDRFVKLCHQVQRWTFAVAMLNLLTLLSLLLSLLLLLLSLSSSSLLLSVIADSTWWVYCESGNYYLHSIHTDFSLKTINLRVAFN